jgi:biotin synthase
MILRISTGSAVLLGIKKYKVFAKPTTVYIMLGEYCVSHCSFCRQKAGSSDYLSRVKWIEVEREELLNNLSKFGYYKRICFQTLDYPDVVKDLLDIIPQIKEVSNKPISVSITPISKKDMLSL